MYRSMLKSKIHQATVTEANLNYMGSITIDREIMEKADIIENEHVHVVNLNNGARLETYVIAGAPGERTFCLNGAAARLVQPGDKIIIMSYYHVSQDELTSYQPRIVLMGENNEVLMEIGKEDEKQTAMDLIENHTNK